MNTHLTLARSAPRAQRPYSQAKRFLMARPKFSAGQRVSAVRSGAFSAPSGAYRIIQPLPRERGAQQYRVRNDAEAYDRILDEARLEAISYE
jgi:hypothetical protein